MNVVPWFRLVAEIKSRRHRATVGQYIFERAVIETDFACGLISADQPDVKQLLP